MAKEIAEALREMYVIRDDVKAAQRGEAYFPVRTRQGDNVPFDESDFIAHVTGEQSFGHYMVSEGGQSKLFAFDIDLDKPQPSKGITYHWRGIEADGTWTDMEPREFHPREAWLHPKAPDNLKRFLISEMRTASDKIADTLRDLLPEVPLGVAYSGNKGLHVYGWTGPYDAEELRQIGTEILRVAGFEATRGNNFFKCDAKTVTVELFPKQGSLDGKDALGNLMRLPLGVNRKSMQKAHFITLSSPIDELREMEAASALKGNPWQT